MSDAKLLALANAIIRKFNITENVPYTVGNDHYLPADEALVKMMRDAGVK